MLAAISGTLLGRLSIRKADLADVEACDRIARQYGRELGWVMRASLEDACNRQCLHVACIDGEVRAFCMYSTPTRGANVGYNVVHTLATQKGWTGMGIGRNLLYSVPTPIRLKCPVGIASNDFYKRAGFQHAGTAVARSGRALNVWELHVLCVHVQGDNRAIPRIARLAGMAYGARHDAQPRDYALMIDIHWRDYDWSDYLEKIRKWSPVMAMVADYEAPQQREQMLKQVNDLQEAGVLVVMVCPKFDGAVKDIPSSCRVAVSVPSRYAGFMPKASELIGRGVHLLGGSPNTQRRLIVEYGGAGVLVKSLDGNAHQYAAQYGKVWTGYKWLRNTRYVAKVDWRALTVVSGRQIVRSMNTATGHRQLSLFDE